VFLEKSDKVGKSFYPAIMKNEPANRGNTVCWNDIMESGVKVYPKGQAAT